MQQPVTHQFTDTERVALSLASFDVAFHQLKIQAKRLIETARPIGKSRNQVAVLRYELENLEEFLNRPEPKWPVLTQPSK